MEELRRSIQRSHLVILVYSVRQLGNETNQINQNNQPIPSRSCHTLSAICSSLHMPSPRTRFRCTPADQYLHLPTSRLAVSSGPS